MALKAPRSVWKGLIAVALVIAVAFPATMFLIRAENAPIKVGILHSRSEPMAISENSMVDAELLAIEEINARGGLLGRKIQPIIADGSPNFIKSESEPPFDADGG